MKTWAPHLLPCNVFVVSLQRRKIFQIFLWIKTNTRDMRHLMTSKNSKYDNYVILIMIFFIEKSKGFSHHNVNCLLRNLS